MDLSVYRDGKNGSEQCERVAFDKKCFSDSKFWYYYKLIFYIDFNINDSWIEVKVTFIKVTFMMTESTYARSDRR